jgi:hypothetical protein
MPYPPVEGRSIEFYNTPEGDFLGTIIKVNEAVSFAPCEVIQTNKGFGMTEKITVKPSIIEFQVWVDVTNSSQLGSFGQSFSNRVLQQDSRRVCRHQKLTN